MNTSAMPKVLLLILFVLIVGTGSFSCAIKIADGSAKPPDPSSNAVNEQSVDPVLAKQIKKSGGKITLPDPVLEQRLKESLAASKRNEVARLKVKVKDGRVFIGGPVTSLEQRNLAESIVRTAPGVKGVHAKVAVKKFNPSPTFHGDRRSLGQITSDKQTRDLVRRRLAASPHIASSRILVEVYDGVVVLSGYVRTNHERKLAREKALFTDSVRSVVNHLQVLPES
jgi:osmotically-inducible protein OsmY